ncbi:MAG TPA: response regulator [Herpetosiphonaceae bacterium]|nr:response regulator [Herpetosiphonaceae bacterium]
MAVVARHSILVIDDEQGVRTFLKTALQGCGYSVDVVKDTTEAEIQLKDGGYIGIIVDFQLPAEDGMTFLQRLRGQGIDIPAILISGYAILDTMVNALDSHIAAFIVKPFELRELIDIVNQSFWPTNTLNYRS